MTRNSYSRLGKSSSCLQASVLITKEQQKDDNKQGEEEGKLKEDGEFTCEKSPLLTGDVWGVYTPATVREEPQKGLGQDDNLGEYIHGSKAYRMMEGASQSSLSFKKDSTHFEE